ncbi:MAG TPA: hypothetical protein VFF06_25785 [Polyangia bacterium]|nr:hypothetical protein [Polyangia bacterium]
MAAIGCAGCSGSTRGTGHNDMSGGGDGPSFNGCATGNFQAMQQPAALLVVLDSSGTMANNNKYQNAQQAIVSAIDLNAFDSMTLGFLGYPTSQVASPSCLSLGGLGPPTVGCGVSGLPQVPLAPAGTMKSSASSGVRHDIYQWLANHSPTPGNGDGNPTYDAIQSGIQALQSWPTSGRRILFYITDGGASCASVSSRQGYTDGNGCNDWEYPDSIVTLIKGAHDAATSSVNTIIVGVPGADGQNGPTGGDPNLPPYHVRLALSSYAYAGSPETVPATCDGKTFSQSGGDPTVACHFDMTTTYTPQVLSNAIDQIRGALLGCVFELPNPDGGTVDPGQVNVQYTVGGNTNTLYKRKDMSNSCVNDGCWDYTSDGKVQLIGKACSDVEGASDANVQIVVGCATVIM